MIIIKIFKRTAKLTEDESDIDDYNMCIVFTAHIKSSSIKKKDAMAIIDLLL